MKFKVGFIFLLIASLFIFFLSPHPVKAQFTGELGSISGTIYWGTELPNSGYTVGLVGNTTGFSLTKYAVGYPGFETGFNLPPDTYTVTAYHYQIGTPNNIGYLVGSKTVTVGFGQAVTADFEISGITGLVEGNLKINGVSSGGVVQFCGPLETDPCPMPTGGSRYFDVNYGPFMEFSGSTGFKMPVLAGNYRAHVITANGLNVGIVPITVNTGQIVADPSLQFQLNLGSISGTIYWDTELPNSGYQIRLVGNTTGFGLWKSALGYPGFETGFNLPPDTYTVTAYHYQIGAPDNVGYFVGSKTVTLDLGQAVTADFDISGTTGFVKGNLTINGVASGGQVQFCGPLQTDPCPVPTGGWPHFDPNDGPLMEFGDVNGFKMPVPPGNYRVHVITTERVDMGIIPISVTSGEVIDLSTTAVFVPLGQNVIVSLAGITVTFSEVTTGGFMTVISTSHPQGGQPPSQYRFLGTYYELTTTAAYTGPVTVSFTYNDADVRGREENLKLFHWDGTTWQNITVSVDTVNNIITGLSPTLSPFAIGEPLETPRELTSLTPIQAWIGLKNSDDVGTRFDLLAEVYKDGNLITSGQLDNVWGGSSGFNNARLNTINFNSFSPVDFPQGSILSIKLYVRNACQGPTHNSGTARLWFDDSAANSHFGATIGNDTSDYFIRDGFVLSTAVGSGPRKTIDVQAGSPCSSFKSFGTWSITP